MKPSMWQHGPCVIPGTWSWRHTKSNETFGSQHNDHEHGSSVQNHCQLPPKTSRVWLSSDSIPFRLNSQYELWWGTSSEWTQGQAHVRVRPWAAPYTWVFFPWFGTLTPNLILYLGMYLWPPHCVTPDQWAKLICSCPFIYLWISNRRTARLSAKISLFRWG